MTKLCECGCGQPAPIATRNLYRAGYAKGEPMRFCHGHNKKPVVPLSVRFMNFVRPEGECWLWGWFGAQKEDGYGSILADGRLANRAYRVAYELFIGAIPDGLELDHLCRNPACVNPMHLEPVTHTENMRRGAWAAASHCRNGHPYDAKNTFVRADGVRRCRKCANARVARYQRRRRTLDTQHAIDLGVSG